MSPDPEMPADPYGLPDADHPHYREGIVNWEPRDDRPTLKKIEKDYQTGEDIPIELPPGWSWLYFDGTSQIRHVDEVIDMLIAMTNAERAHFAKENFDQLRGRPQVD
jgi:hypothetical protein